MDFVSIITFITSTFGISATTAGILSKMLLDHKFSEKREEMKLTLAADLRQEVETILAEQGADREYRLEARKRLYMAIGPLKFQLLVACRDLSGRVISHGLRASYDTCLEEYYGRSFLFRIIRPLAISEIAERQMSYADFSIDQQAIEIFKFKKNAFAAFSGGNLVKGHSGVVWNTQEQHIFFDYLSRNTNALITDEDKKSARVIRYDEFESILSDNNSLKRFEPFRSILHDFSIRTKTLFWLRLVAYAYLCNMYINRAGQDIGFEEREFPLTDLLLASNDPEIHSQISVYEQRCRDLLQSPL